MRGQYALGGLTTGYGFARRGAPNGGVLLGSEVSFVNLTRDLYWFGAYADGLYDFGAGEGRFSVGPEVGVAFFGLDGGYLAVVGPGGTQHGFTVRPLLTCGLASAYVRYGQVVTGTDDRFGEVGLLVKLPFFEQHPRD